MAVQRELAAFIRDAFEAGRSRDEIDAMLERAGWKPSERREALDMWTQDVEGLTIPRPHSRSPGTALMNSLLIAALGLVVWHIVSLGFEVIDRHFVPAGLDTSYTSYDMSASSMRFSISALIVFTPLFIYLSHLAEAEQKAEIETGRKWFVFVALLTVAFVLLGALAGVIYRILTGDLTTAFLLKTVLVAITALLVMWYYRGDLDVKS